MEATSKNGIISIFRTVVLIGLVVFLGYTVWQNASSENSSNPFKLGLDLAGGSHLVYEADTSAVDPEEITELMNVLKEVIERRVNIFGVSEPIVQVETSSFVTEERSDRLVVELPGVTDVSQAIAEIGRTPLLEFKLLDLELLEQQQTLEALDSITASSGAQIGNVRVNGEAIDEDVEPFVDTGLTGRYLESASLEFAGGQSGQLANEPIVSVQFSSEGADLFASITRDNVGQQLGIFLDGELLSAPVINEPILGGTAVISGGFDPDEARALAENLSFGALPLPISLQSTQTIGPTLGAEILEKGVQAGLIGVALVMLYMIFWYRLPGLLASISLVSYVIIMLALFQYIPVTLTAAGLAGFVLSLGMAVDANVLVFERLKEEIRSGKTTGEATSLAFQRAWTAIRDGNVTSILSAIILFWFGTSLVKGFALVFGIGVITSMFSALVITRALLIIVPDYDLSKNKVMKFLYGTGLKS